jgi:thiamine biosynthesis protein ThiI
VISRATDQMILRPLVGTNKDEIIRSAEHIGTFPLSKVVGEYCNLVPSKPATSATLRAVETEEARLGPGALERAVARRSVFDLRSLGAEDLALPELEVTRIPEGAALIDLRGKPEYDSWHHPDALRLDFHQALQAYPSFERGRSYVLYCDFGLMSAHLAELMRKDGFDASHFKGGTRALRRQLES